MSMINLSNMLSSALENIKAMIDVETVVGKPILTDNDTIIPLSKVTFGFLTGGGELGQSKNREDDTPFGGIGGGVTVTPIGFVVINKEGTSLIKTQGDNVDKWLDIVQSTIKSLKKE